MNATVIDLATERRRRARAAIRVMTITNEVESIEVHASDVPSMASPHARQQLAMMLEGEEIEFQFTPRLTLIERLRFTHSADDLAELISVTLEKVS